FMVAGPTELFVGIRCGKQVDVYSGTAHAVIQLVAEMQPFARHAFDDRMLGIADRHQEWVHRAMTSAWTFALGDSRLLAVGIQCQAIAEAIAAPAHADHAVVFSPALE